MLSKKKRVESERVEGLIAAARRQARRESETRVERMGVLWGEIRAWLKQLAKELVSGEVEPSLIVWGQASREIVRSVLDLLVEQRREIKYLAGFKRDLERVAAYDAKGLERLLVNSWRALQPGEAADVGDERKRRVYRPSGAGLIEEEFDGAGEAKWKEGLLGLSGLAYEPKCLDEILRGGVGEGRTLPGVTSPVTGGPVVIDTLTTMRRLEELFGLERHRFPKKLPWRRVGREVVYDWGAVVAIMRALLKENRKRRKKRGPAVRRWLEKPVVRSRVLSGIEERIKAGGATGEIADAFLSVIQEFRS